jgi:hypothetical protein
MPVPGNAWRSTDQEQACILPLNGIALFDQRPLYSRYECLLRVKRATPSATPQLTRVCLEKARPANATQAAVSSALIRVDIYSIHDAEEPAKFSRQHLLW